MEGGGDGEGPDPAAGSPSATEGLVDNCTGQDRSSQETSSEAVGNAAPEAALPVEDGEGHEPGDAKSAGAASPLSTDNPDAPVDTASMPADVAEAVSKLRHVPSNPSSGQCSPNRRRSSGFADRSGPPGSMILTSLVTHVHEFPGLAEDVRKEYIRTVLVTPLESGFGFTFATTQDRSPPEMVHIKPKGAAATAGILVGDRIVAVGPTITVFSSHAEVVDLIRAATGPENGPVSITLLRKDVPRPILRAAPRAVHGDGPVYGPFGFEVEDSGGSFMDGSEVGDSPEKPTVGGGGAHGRPASDQPHAQQANSFNTSAAQRRKWIKFLKTINSTMVEPVWHIPEDSEAFDPKEQALKFGRKPGYQLPISDTTTALVSSGVPHNLRRQVWLRSCGAAAGSTKVSLRYDELALCAAAELDGTETANQIEKDLLRTFPTNLYFSEMDREGTRRLRRVLMTAAWTLPSIGYCQGMGMLAAILLLVLEEDETYWAFRAVVTKLLPSDYFSSTLLGAMADQRVLADLIRENEEKVFKALQQNGIELSLITMSWFMTAFCTIAPLHTTLRIWDYFLLEGSVVLFKVSLAMITLRAPYIASMEDSGELFNALSETPSFMNDPDRLLNLAFSFMHIEQELAALRKRHVGDLTAEIAEIQKRRQELADSREASPSDSGAKDTSTTSPTLRVRKRPSMFRLKGRDAASPRFGRKSKSRVQSKLLMALSQAVHDLVVHMQELVDQEDEEEQERLRLRAHVVDYISEKEGGLGEDDHFQAPRQGSIAGDARKNPVLAELTKEGLFSALSDLLNAGFQVQPQDDKSQDEKNLDEGEESAASPVSVTLWDFCCDICRPDAGFDWEASAVPESIRESHETMVAAVTSIDLCPLPSEDSSFLQLFCKGLNAGLVEDWFDVLAFAAAQTKFKHYYDSTAHIRTKAVKIQVKEDLRRLKQFKFNIV